MKPARTYSLEELEQLQRKLDRRREIGAAYMSDDDRWQAARFAMDVFHEMEEIHEVTIKKCFAHVKSADALESLLFPSYDIMSSEDLRNSVYDIENYVARKTDNILPGGIFVPTENPYPRKIAKRMMTEFEFQQFCLHRETEGKLIAAMSLLPGDGLLSTALGTYLDNPWMEERIFSTVIENEDAIEDLVNSILQEAGLST